MTKKTMTAQLNYQFAAAKRENKENVHQLGWLLKFINKKAADPKMWNTTELASLYELLGTNKLTKENLLRDSMTRVCRLVKSQDGDVTQSIDFDVVTDAKGVTFYLVPVVITEFNVLSSARDLRKAYTVAEDVRIAEEKRATKAERPKRATKADKEEAERAAAARMTKFNELLAQGCTPEEAFRAAI